MTLKEAYTEWAKQPRNKLAVIYRQAIEKVLLKENADIELYSFTTSFVRGILQTSSECQELKAQAVSALMCIIEWGRKNGHCGACAFGLEILQPKEDVSPEDASSEVVQSEDQRHDDADHEDELPECEHPEDVYPEGVRPMPKRSTISRPVVELSPELEVMRTFSSASECIRVTKITSLYFFLQNHSIRNGHYYAYKDEWESGTWEPRTEPKPTPKVRKAKPKTRKKKPKTKAEVRAALKKVGAAARAEVQQSSLQELSDQQLFDELKRRGFEGTLTQKKIVTVTI